MDKLLEKIGNPELVEDLYDAIAPGSNIPAMGIGPTVFRINALRETVLILMERFEEFLREGAYPGLNPAHIYELYQEFMTLINEDFDDNDFYDGHAND